MSRKIQGAQGDSSVEGARAQRSSTQRVSRTETRDMLVEVNSARVNFQSWSDNTCGNILMTVPNVVRPRPLWSYENIVHELIRIGRDCSD